jgi:PST family polysaccharide transporter
MLVLVPDGRRLAFDREAAHRILQFGIPSAATSLMGFLSERGSELVVAIFLGTRTLGVYFIAARLPAQLYQVGGNLSAPVLTAFSRSTQEQLGRGFVLATRFSAFFILLPLAFVIPLAQPFVTTVYGDKWSAAAAPLVLLTAAIAVRLTFWHTANLLKSRGRVKEITMLTALQLVLVLGLAALGAWAFGAVGAAAAVLIVELVLAAAKIRLARSMVTFAAVRTLRAPLVALVFGALLAGAAAWLLQDAAALVVGGVLVCAAFAVIAWRSDRTTITAIVAAVRRPAAGVG